MERREPATFGGRAEEARRNDGRSVRDGIPPLDDDGRGHHCGARVYRSCISSKQERAGHRVEPGTGIHPNRTTKGYARICVGCWWTEGEGEMNETPDARLRLLWFAAALAAMIVIAFIVSFARKAPGVGYRT